MQTNWTILASYVINVVPLSVSDRVVLLTSSKTKVGEELSSTNAYAGIVDREFGEQNFLLST